MSGQPDVSVATGQSDQMTGLKWVAVPQAETQGRRNPRTLRSDSAAASSHRSRAAGRRVCQGRSGPTTVKLDGTTPCADCVMKWVRLVWSEAPTRVTTSA